MTALTIAGTSLRRYFRDRVALFFVIVLPVLVIVVIGATVSGVERLRIGVVDTGSGSLGAELSTALAQSPTLKVQRYSSVDAARLGIRRGEVVLSVVVPPGFDADARSGVNPVVTVLGDRTSSNEQAAESAVSAVVGAQAARLQAARFAASNGGGTLDTTMALADQTASSTPSIEVRDEAVDTTRHVLPEGFSYSAPTMLVLFVFINALAGGAAIIESRRLGVYQRMLAAPLSSRSIVLGETLCYLTLALVQSILIVSVGTLLFGVSWGDPVAAAALIISWALVGTGAGVLSGTLFRTPEQASSIGPALGIAFGMLGGCMWPLSLVPSAMNTLGHAFPHAWAVDAWTTLLSQGGDLLAIVGPLFILLGFALVLLTVAAYRLRYVVTA